MCPHGGSIQLSTANVEVFVDGDPVLLETDIHSVSGCPFMIGNKASPCIRVEWKMGTARSHQMGMAFLHQDSMGQCFSPENLLQGLAQVVNTQMKVESV